MILLLRRSLAQWWANAKAVKAKKEKLRMLQLEETRTVGSTFVKFNIISCWNTVTAVKKTWHVRIENRFRPLSLVPVCPKNCKNRRFLRFFDVWHSYEHPIPNIPDGRQFLRCDRKNRKHFYFEGTSAIFTVSVKHESCLSGTLRMLDFVFTFYQSLIFSELAIINV